MSDKPLMPFDALIVHERDLAQSHLALGDAICAMRAGWSDTARELLTLSNDCLFQGGYDPLTAERHECLSSILSSRSRTNV